MTGQRRRFGAVSTVITASQDLRLRVRMLQIDVLTELRQSFYHHHDGAARPCPPARHFPMTFPDIAAVQRTFTLPFCCPEEVFDPFDLLRPRKDPHSHVDVIADG